MQMSQQYEEAQAHMATQKEYAAGIICLLEAEKGARQLDDAYYLGLIYHSISYIYEQTYSPAEQLNYARLAYDEFLKAGRSDCLNKHRLVLAEAYYANKDDEECIRLARQAWKEAVSQSDKTLQCRSLRLLGNAALRSNRYEEGKEALLRLQESDDSLTVADYRNLTHAYMKLGQYDSAKIYRAHLPISTEQGMWVMVKNPYTGRFQSTVLETAADTLMRDTTSREIIRQNLAQTVAGHQAYEQSLREAEVRQERWSKYVILGVACLMVIFLCVLYRMHLKAHRREMEIKMLEAENIRHILRLTEEDAASMRGVVDGLFEQKFRSIDELCNTYYIYQGSKNERAKIYANVMEIITHLSSDRKTLAELEAYVNTYKDNLMAEFREDYPALKEEEYTLYLYLTVRFSSRALSILLGESLPVVYNRKSRLKKEIMRGATPRKERFLAVFG